MTGPEDSQRGRVLVRVTDQAGATNARAQVVDVASSNPIGNCEKPEW